MQPITAISQTSTASSNARMKTSPPVSITMTPVPITSGTGSSTSQVSNTAKIKSVITSEANSVFPHGVSSSVTMRTKCSIPSSQNVNSQVHMVCSGAPVLSSVSPSYATSNVRNSPNSTNSTKLSSSQLVTAPSVPNRKKTGSDVTIAKVPSSSGKSSPSFQSEKQLPLPSVKQKLNVERISPKMRDLSSSSVNRSVTVSVPSSPSKTKSSPLELITTSCSVQKSVTMASLPLMNIPDCISVTPSLPSPSHASVTATVSPPITTTPKSMMSLKQRILHETNLDQPSIITRMSPMPMVMKAEDDGIEVIEIVRDAHKTDGPKVNTKQIGKSDNVTQSKSEFRKKKKEISKDHMAPTTAALSAPLEQPAPIVPPAAPCQQEKEVERLLKEEEETAAAADFLSQINESLKNFPNSTAGAGNRDIYHEERVIPCDQETPLYISPKIDTLSPPSAISPSSDQRGNSSHGGEEKGKLNNSKGTDLKKKEQTTAQDDEESVQMEVDRVMKELIELQGHFNAEKKPDTVDLDYSSTKTKVPPITTNCSSVSVTVSVPGRTQQSKPSKQYAESPVPLMGRRPSTGSTDLSKLSYGFQDEFQKHLFQETMNKQEPEVPNSYKMARSKAPMAYSQVNQTAIHSSITSRHNQNSSLEGM